MRLTNQLRDKIIGEVLEITLKKDAAKLEKREHDIAQRVYNALYPKAMRDQMNSLPRGFMHEDKCLRVNLGGLNLMLHTKDPVRVPAYTDPTDKNMAHGYRNGCQRLGNINNPGLHSEYLELHADTEKHKGYAKKVEAETRALLYSLQTYAQLEKTWPEGKKFYAKYKPVNNESQLPAILISDLNKTLGITKG